MIRILLTSPDEKIEASILKDGIPWKTISMPSASAVLEHSQALLEFLEEFAAAAATLLDPGQITKYELEFRERCNLLCRLLRFEEEGLFSLPGGTPFDLYVAPDLNGIPFELALGPEFLSIRFNVMRTFQGEQIQRRYRPIRAFYAFNASADPALYSGREFTGKTIQSRLHALCPDVRFKHGKSIQAAGLLKHLSTVDSVVLTTHGLPDRIPLAHGTLEAEDLGVIHFGNIRFFLNNSCYGTAGAPNTIGQIFLKSGVEHYVGHATRVALDRSARIAESILDELAAGRSLREAVYSARLTSFRENPSEPAWASLQYFGSGNLWCLPKESAPVTSRRSIVWKVAAAAIVVLGIVALVGQLHRLPPSNPVPSAAAEAGITQSSGVPADSSGESPPSLQATEQPGCGNENDCSPDLQRIIARFRSAPHPVYNAQDKENIIAEILESRMSDRHKIIAIQNEIP